MRSRISRMCRGRKPRRFRPRRPAAPCFRPVCTRRKRLPASQGRKFHTSIHSRSSRWRAGARLRSLRFRSANTTFRVPRPFRLRPTRTPAPLPAREASQTVFSCQIILSGAGFCRPRRIDARDFGRVPKTANICRSAPFRCCRRFPVSCLPASEAFQPEVRRNR